MYTHICAQHIDTSGSCVFPLADTDIPHPQGLDRFDPRRRPQTPGRCPQRLDGLLGLFERFHNASRDEHISTALKGNAT